MISEQTATDLANEIVTYIHSRRDKKAESFLKDQPKKNKQGMVTNGAINMQLIGVAKQLFGNAETVTTLEKSKKSKEQSALDFQLEKYEKLLALFPEGQVNTEVLDLKVKYQEFKTTNDQEHEVVSWLTQWTGKAKDISFATHVGKLTHSSSKSSSILDGTTDKNNGYLTTNSLNTPEIDTASSNAASLPIADILKLSVNGYSILDCLKDGDIAVFEKLTTEAPLIQEWVAELKQAYDSSTKQSYFLSKQTYFPLPDKSYHLLLPLKSSSIIHALHARHQDYFSDEQVEARAQRKNKQYSPITARSYPKKAKLHATGSNHSNASSLNGKRGGVITLLSCMPPTWESKGASYQNSSSVFGKRLSYELAEEVDEVRKYLKLLKNKSLSQNDNKRNAAIVRKLKAVSDAFFDYIMAVNQQEDSAGWTCNSELPIEQQLLFEPSRDDDIAKEKTINNNWQKDVSKSYGRWLNKQLNKRSKLKLSLIHEELWTAFFSSELREYIAIQEVTL